MSHMTLMHHITTFMIQLQDIPTHSRCMNMPALLPDLCWYEHHHTSVHHRYNCVPYHALLPALLLHACPAQA